MKKNSQYRILAEHPFLLFSSADFHCIWWKENYTYGGVHLDIQYLNLPLGVTRPYGWPSLLPYFLNFDSPILSLKDMATPEHLVYIWYS